MEGTKFNETNGHVRRVQIRKMQDVEQFIGAFKQHEAKISHILDMGRVVKHASRKLSYLEYISFCEEVGVGEKAQHALRKIGEIAEEQGNVHLSSKILLAIDMWELLVFELALE